MIALRRHLFGVTWAILSVHVSVGVLGAALLCSEREHTHGGVVAPDCPMHHTTNADGQPLDHHAHHSAMTPSDADGSAAARVSCRCSGDLLTLFIGQLAVLHPPVSHAPFMQAVLFGPLSKPNALDRWVSPPSPPPR